MVQVLPANKQNVIEFWQRICGFPAAQNPMLDTTGGLVLSGQLTSGLLFLPGSRGPKVIRNIPQNLPPGRDIFIAVNPVVVTEPEAGTNNTNDLVRFAREDEDSATSAKLTINGQSHNLLIPSHRVGTGPFNVNFPNNPIFGGQSGTFPAAADGYYAIIQGLPPGNNMIEIDAQVNSPFPAFHEPVPWKDNVTYNF
jgi:hypothetical protein